MTKIYEYKIKNKERKASVEIAKTLVTRGSVSINYGYFTVESLNKKKSYHVELLYIVNVAIKIAVTYWLQK